jgi:hypothetical protein
MSIEIQGSFAHFLLLDEMVFSFYFIFKNNCLRCCVVQYGWGVGRLIEKTDADNNNINVISIQQAAKK